MFVNTYLYQLNEEDIQLSENLLKERLSVAEVRRVQDIKHQNSRRAMMMARILLRRLLACYLECQPLEVAIEIAPGGKPQLNASINSEKLFFNISHSGNFILIAISSLSQVGVDIEIIKPRYSLDDLAAYVMHPGELEVYQRLTKGEAELFFFRAWVLKEAYVKYLGKGIVLGLKTVQTQFQPAAVVGVPEVAAQYLEVPTGYAACLVFKGLEAPGEGVRQSAVNSVYDDLSPLCG